MLATDPRRRGCLAIRLCGIGTSSLMRKGSLGPIRQSRCGGAAGARLGETSREKRDCAACAFTVCAMMLEHYSHILLEAKRGALEALARRPSHVAPEGDARAGYGTKNVTMSQPEATSERQVIEKRGGRHGIRTHGLLVANEALSQLS